MEHQPFPFLHPQENQVARSQIKHADEHQRVKCDPRLRGCFCVAQPRRDSRFNFVSWLSPPFFCYWWCSLSSASVLTPFLLPFGCESANTGKRWAKWGGMDNSASLTELLPFCLWIRGKKCTAGQLYSAEEPFSCNITKRAVHCCWGEITHLYSSHASAYFPLITCPCYSGDKRLISTLLKLHCSSRDKEKYTKVMTTRGQAWVLILAMNVGR